jgi:hypothetical protein
VCGLRKLSILWLVLSNDRSREEDGGRGSSHYGENVKNRRSMMRIKRVRKILVYGNNYHELRKLP